MNKFMRLIVFFDLPVGTKEERREATRFRNDLIKNGYYMVQFSVYARLCNGVDSTFMHLARLKTFAPKTGSIRCMSVTEKQYASIYVVSGKKVKKEMPAQNIQMSFL